MVLMGVLAPSAIHPAEAQSPRNVVFILSDDHRYDFMSFMEEAPDFLETPNLDALAAEGMHIRNAFVTTSLCSPSRASILTGRYAHSHGIVDNSSPIPEGTHFFPELLQEAGYATGFFGKWHMGHETDDPKPGFDRWVSFRGQGVYVNPTLNIDGERRQEQGYVTDLLTDYALDWLEQQQADRPFFLYLSHKAVHAEFQPAERHEGRYSDEVPQYPASMDNIESNYRGKPRWVREQRYSWHGVEHAYHGELQFDSFYLRYAETLLGVDESVGRVRAYLDESGLAENTLLIYMGDNGFMLGEHGLIDKRQAYEESMRVPMLAYAPGLIQAGTVATDLVRNIDVAPTLLDVMDQDVPAEMDGRSVLSLLRGEPATWDDELLYEYYWEYAFPHTPTVFALRGDRYKYIFYHGVWDRNELYDLQTDPKEQFNLVDLPAHAERATAMRNRIFDLLEETGGMQIPLRRAGWQADERLLRD
jgi:N-acetylglucosamine-6-sulfatase